MASVICMYSVWQWNGWGASFVTQFKVEHRIVTPLGIISDNL